jgi:hypothetical protein
LKSIKETNKKKIEAIIERVELILMIGIKAKKQMKLFKERMEEM